MSEPVVFVAMRLTGRRFDEVGMPVEALAELAAYRDLVAAVARELFFRRNPARKRVPRGFADSFQLRLSGIRSGSAVPVLERATSDSSLFPSRNDELFDDARDMVQDAILSVAGSGRLPEDFPRDIIPDFSRFGRTLSAGEFIELSSTSRPRPARYSAAVRRILIKSRRAGYLQEASVSGYITEVNSDRSSFDLQVIGEASRSISCSFERELFEQVLRHLRPPGDEGVPVRVEGFISFDHADRPVAVPHVLGIAATDSEEGDDEGAPLYLVNRLADSTERLNDAFDRLAELESLEPGWLDGAGSSVSRDALEFVRGVITRIPPGTLSELRFYPTEKGAVRIEWQRYSTEFSLDIGPDDLIFYDEADLHTGSETERTLSFEDVDDVRVLLVGE